MSCHRANECMPSFQKVGFLFWFGFCFGFLVRGFFGFFFESSFRGERSRVQIFTGSSLAPLVSASLDQMHKLTIKGTFWKVPVLLRGEKTLL